jgi:hypothetical protein
MNAHNRIDVGMSQLLALVTVVRIPANLSSSITRTCEPFDFIVRQLQGIDGPDRIYQQQPCSTDEGSASHSTAPIELWTYEMFFCMTLKARGIEPPPQFRPFYRESA